MSLVDFKNEYIPNIAPDYLIKIKYYDPSINEVSDMILKFDEFKVDNKMTVIYY